MAKIDSSFITLKGTLQGMNFYLRKGVPVVRKAGGGFNGKSIKNNPNMERVRENSSEFGHCSRVSKVLRQGFYPFFLGWDDKTLHSRMMRVLTQIKDLDKQSVRGQRKIGVGLETDEGKKLLQKFDFIPQTKLDKPLGEIIDFDPTNYTCSLRSVFVENVKLPKGATHVKMLFGTVQVDFNTLKTSTFLSETLTYSLTEIPAEVVLTPVEFSDSFGMKISVLGVRFFQLIGGEHYLLQSDHAGGVWILGIE